MRYETFEKAQEIKKELDYLDAVADVVRNAAYGMCTLAALGPCDPYDPTVCRTKNEEKLTNELRDEFLMIIQRNKTTLQKEFDTL